MKHKTAELEGELLDAAVARALAMRDQRFSSTPDWFPRTAVFDDFYGDEFEPSTRWDHGGPIVQLERIDFENGGQHAIINRDRDGVWTGDGATHLIAAMRAFVASKLGEEVDL